MFPLNNYKSIQVKVYISLLSSSRFCNHYLLKSSWRPKEFQLQNFVIILKTIYFFCFILLKLNEMKTQSCFVWDNMCSIAFLSYLLFYLLFLIFICPPGLFWNVINQYINKHPDRRISEMQTQTHTCSNLSSTDSCILTDLEPSPGQTWSLKALRQACLRHRSSKSGHKSQLTSHPFLKKHYGSRWTYTHIYTNTHAVTLRCGHVPYRV